MSYPDRTPHRPGGIAELPYFQQLQYTSARAFFTTETGSDSYANMVVSVIPETASGDTSGLIPGAVYNCGQGLQAGVGIDAGGSP